MEYKVAVSAKATRDLNRLYEWLLEQHAGEPRLRWLEGLQTAMMSLRTAPRRCMIAPENAVFSFEVRQLLYGNKPHIYRILFTVKQDTVTVLHIRHGRRLSLPS